MQSSWLCQAYLIFFAKRKIFLLERKKNAVCKVLHAVLRQTIFVAILRTFKCKLSGRQITVL